MGREANNSPSFSAEVKNNWSCNSTPPIRLHVFRPFFLPSSFLFILIFQLVIYYVILSFQTIFVPKKQGDIQSPSGCLFVCLFVWLVGWFVCSSIYILEPSGRFLRNLVWTNNPCRSAIVLALYEVQIKLLHTNSLSC